MKCPLWGMATIPSKNTEINTVNYYNRMIILHIIISKKIILKKALK